MPNMPFRLPPQYLGMLLAADDAQIVVATLRALVVFVRKTHSSGVRWHGDPNLNSRLLAMAQGWGSTEEVRAGCLSYRYCLTVFFYPFWVEVLQ